MKQANNFFFAAASGMGHYKEYALGLPKSNLNISIDVGFALHIFRAENKTDATMLALGYVFGVAFTHAMTRALTLLMEPAEQSYGPN